MAVLLSQWPYKFTLQCRFDLANYRPGREDCLGRARGDLSAARLGLRIGFGEEIDEGRKVFFSEEKKQKTFVI
jgi:hypothetical protein